MKYAGILFYNQVACSCIDLPGSAIVGEIIVVFIQPKPAYLTLSLNASVMQVSSSQQLQFLHTHCFAMTVHNQFMSSQYSNVFLDCK